MPRRFLFVLDDHTDRMTLAVAKSLRHAKRLPFPTAYDEDLPMARRGSSRGTLPRFAGGHPAGLAAVALLAAGMLSSRAGAQTVWVPAGVGNWVTPANWSAGVPTATSDARINNGGTAQLFDTTTSNLLTLGGPVGGSGTVDVDGGMLTLDRLTIGASGAGTAILHRQGHLNANTISLAVDSTATGSASVDGSMSRMTAFTDLAVGIHGDATLSITGGGRAESHNGDLGQFVDGTGDVTVTGTGSWWQSMGMVSVGGAGAGTLTIADGGIVTSVFGRIGRDPGSTGVVVIDGVGSRWSCTAAVTVASTGPAPSAGTLTLRNGGAVFAAGGVMVNPGGVLQGAGDIVGNLTNLARVAPGDSIGNLRVAGNYTQSAVGAGVALDIQLASATSFDSLAVSGNAALGGVLNVTLLNGYVPAAGVTFNILDWGSRSGTFSTVNLPSLQSPLAWDTSQLYVDGSLSVTSPSFFHAADFDENHAVAGADLAKWKTGFGVAIGATHMQGDADGDGDADGADFLLWQRQLGMSSPGLTSQPAPEPPVSAVLAGALLALLARGIGPSGPPLAAKNCC
jgi:T5SS/PEP-CTERM-associated repeat protein